MVDPQMDEFQQGVLKLPFDPLDMPAGHFITGGRAWQMCRSEGADPGKFGIFEMSGMEFVRGNLLRDFLALNKVEILPWDGWKPLFDQPYPEMDPADLALLDRLAGLTLAGDEAFLEIRSIFEADPRLHFPEFA
jgi:hypothetical protein